MAPLVSRFYLLSDRQPSASPPDAEIEAARRIVDYRAVRLDRDSVVLEDARMSITLDGIAKGYIVDRTIDVLVSAGSERVLGNAGGGMATGGGGPLQAPWTTGRQAPPDPPDAVVPGRLGRGGSWWTCVLESDSPERPQPPMRLLPNQKLENRTRAQEASTESIVFEVSGELTLFASQNYLLVRKSLRRRSATKHRSSSSQGWSIACRMMCSSQRMTFSRTTSS